MSADNGLYILVTPKGKGFEYRVAHLQAVENYGWDDELGCSTDNPDVHIKNAREMWGDSLVHTDITNAYECARILLSSIGWTEYGICEINIPREF
jgi:hypothetical protein